MIDLISTRRIHEWLKHVGAHSPAAPAGQNSIFSRYMRYRSGRQIVEGRIRRIKKICSDGSIRKNHDSDARRFFKTGELLSVPRYIRLLQPPCKGLEILGFSFSCVFRPACSVRACLRQQFGAQKRRSDALLLVWCHTAWPDRRQSMILDNNYGNPTGLHFS